MERLRNILSDKLSYRMPVRTVPQSREPQAEFSTGKRIIFMATLKQSP